jgi:hypothetical protein
VYSNVVTLTATPYVDIRDYPSIYVPGGYQGWSPDKAAKLSSVSNNKVYEGYINFPDANSEFKFTLGPNWDDNLGVAATAKSLTADGGNLKVTDPVTTWSKRT